MKSIAQWNEALALALALAPASWVPPGYRRLGFGRGGNNIQPEYRLARRDKNDPRGYSFDSTLGRVVGVLRDREYACPEEFYEQLKDKFDTKYENTQGK